MQAALRPESESVPFDRVRLAEYLAAAGIEFDPSEPVRQFAGGLANLNYRVVVNGRAAVLRRPPPGELPAGAHDMAREHRILSRLSAALPIVPASIHFCPDASVLGAAFQLIEYRPGVVLRGSDLSPLPREARSGERLSRILLDALVRIHGVDTAAAGLDDLGRPDGFVPRAIQGWRRRGGQASSSPRVARLVEEIGDWLARRPVAPRRPTLLHCDFKLDNLIVDPDTLAVSAVVDWDMGTRGDPLFDLATLLSYWSQAGDPECMRRLDQMPTLLPGFWSREKVAAAYARATGTDVSDLPAMRVLCMYKLGIVFLQLHARWSAGPAREPRYASFAALGEDLLVFTKDIAEGRAL